MLSDRNIMLMTVVKSVYLIGLYFELNWIFNVNCLIFEINYLIIYFSEIKVEMASDRNIMVMIVVQSVYLNWSYFELNRIFNI